MLFFVKLKQVNLLYKASVIKVAIFSTYLFILLTSAALLIRQLEIYLKHLVLLNKFLLFSSNAYFLKKTFLIQGLSDNILFHSYAMYKYCKDYSTFIK